MNTGIIIEPTNSKIAQEYECYHCGREVRSGSMFFYMDRDTLEVLDPEFEHRAMPAWPLGPECMKRYPGIRQYAIRTASSPPGTSP